MKTFDKGDTVVYIRHRHALSCEVPNYGKQYRITGSQDDGCGETLYYAEGVDNPDKNCMFYADEIDLFKYKDFRVGDKVKVLDRVLTYTSVKAMHESVGKVGTILELDGAGRYVLMLEGKRMPQVFYRDEIAVTDEPLTPAPPAPPAPVLYNHKYKPGDYVRINYGLVRKIVRIVSTNPYAASYKVSFDQSGFVGGTFEESHLDPVTEFLVGDKVIVKSFSDFGSSITHDKASLHVGQVREIVSIEGHAGQWVNLHGIYWAFSRRPNTNNGHKSIGVLEPAPFNSGIRSYQTDAKFIKAPVVANKKPEVPVKIIDSPTKKDVDMNHINELTKLLREAQQRNDRLISVNDSLRNKNDKLKTKNERLEREFNDKCAVISRMNGYNIGLKSTVSALESNTQLDHEAYEHLKLDRDRWVAMYHSRRGALTKLGEAAAATTLACAYGVSSGAKAAGRAAKTVATAAVTTPVRAVKATGRAVGRFAGNQWADSWFNPPGGLANTSLVAVAIVWTVLTLALSLPGAAAYLGYVAYMNNAVWSQEKSNEATTVPRAADPEAPSERQWMTVRAFKQLPVAADESLHKF